VLKKLQSMWRTLSPRVPGDPEPRHKALIRRWVDYRMRGPRVVTREEIDERRSRLQQHRFLG
jgi:hypothetical protein